MMARKTERANIEGECWGVPPFSLDACVLDRDPDKTDAECGERLALFVAVSPVSAGGTVEAGAGAAAQFQERPLDEVPGRGRDAADQDEGRDGGPVDPGP